MIVPVRCFSCGKLLAHAYEEFVKKSAKEPAEKVMDDLGIERYCCRRTLFSHAELIEEIMKYNA